MKLILLLFSLVFACGAQAQDETVQVGNRRLVGFWYLDATGTPSGLFLYCSLTLFYPDETLLNVARSKKGHISFYASNPKWELPSSGIYDGKFDFDGILVRPIAYEVFGTGFMTDFVEGEQEKLWQELAKSSFVTFSALTSSLPFQVGDTGIIEAVVALKECTDSNGRIMLSP